MTKRPSSSQSISREHPVVAFHREVLIVQQWTLIRQSFLTELQSTEKHGITWKEPNKLWRHSQEALGKWVLSQVARVKRGDGGGDGVGVEGPGERCLDSHLSDLHFFPTAEDFSQFSPAGRAYDEQLIRDLTMKCQGGAHDAAVMAKVKQLVQVFHLAKRCDAAHRAVETQLADALDYAHAHAHATPSQSMGQYLARPRLRRLEEDDPARSPMQRRVRGPIAEFAVQWPAHWQRSQTRNCPPVSIPWAALQKLRMTYTHHNASKVGNSSSSGGGGGGEALHRDDEATHEVHISLTTEESFLYRAAVVALRYEGGLATGSLQLCADTSLKQHLHARGYHVMDLCASPINAYMGTPVEGTFRGGGGGPREGAEGERPSCLDEEQERPNHYCSAFLDTDRYFGSLGSALRVDPLALYKSSHVNPHRRPLLLTLDVPYDEDLCEMLFQKLTRDMARAESDLASVQVDYVLVLPLWWSIPLRIERHLFSDGVYVGSSGAGGAGTEGGLAATVMQVMEERNAVLGEGYRVSYHWPEALARAAGDTTAHGAPANTEPPSPPWVCFDGLFVGQRGYTYFCSTTNRWLQGVTATEVIGLQQPRQPRNAAGDGRPLLATALREYYLL